jgi:hypothetical protein
MEAIREIMDASRLTPVMDIPQHLRSSKVEVIVLPLPKQEGSPRNGKNMMGFLKEYADLALVEREKEAWELHLKEKYGTV